MCPVFGLDVSTFEGNVSTFWANVSSLAGEVSSEEGERAKARGARRGAAGGRVSSLRFAAFEMSTVRGRACGARACVGRGGVEGGQAGAGNDVNASHAISTGAAGSSCNAYRVGEVGIRARMGCGSTGSGTQAARLVGCCRVASFGRLRTGSPKNFGPGHQAWECAVIGGWCG